MTEPIPDYTILTYLQWCESGAPPFKMEWADYFLNRAPKRKGKGK